jgi:hypothetical protein
MLIAEAICTGRDSRFGLARACWYQRCCALLLLHGSSNGRSPEGGPESRLWAAVVERGQGEPHGGERPHTDVWAGPQRSRRAERQRPERLDQKNNIESKSHL